MRVLLALALTLACTAVFSHGSEQWINDAKLVDPVSKEFCCGPTDCSALTPGSVERVSGAIFVGWDHALPFSPDGHYHICIGYDESLIPNVRCFITPPSAV